MEIDLHTEPPTAKEIEAARRELENSRLLIIQNEAYVAKLYHRLLVKGIMIAAILVIAVLLYFILPGEMFGMVNGRTILFVAAIIFLVMSMLWIGWRTWKEARALVPGRGHSKVQMQGIKSRTLGLTDSDVKQRLNVVNWSRADGVLTQYLKKISRQRRHLICLEYVAIIKHIKKVSSNKHL